MCLQQLRTYQRAHLTIPENADNFSLNVAYYYVDDVLAYDQTMRNQVMNTRIRIDVLTTSAFAAIPHKDTMPETIAKKEQKAEDTTGIFHPDIWTT